MGKPIKMATPANYEGTWEIVTEENKSPSDVATSETWLEVRHYGYGNGYRDPLSIDVEAAAKWDGCCHFYYGQGDDRDYLHICGGIRAIDEVIERLEEFKALAIEHFARTGKGLDDEWGPRRGRG